MDPEQAFMDLLEHPLFQSDKTNQNADDLGFSLDLDDTEGPSTDAVSDKDNREKPWSLLARLDSLDGVWFRSFGRQGIGHLRQRLDLRYRYRQQRGLDQSVKWVAAIRLDANLSPAIDRWAQTGAWDSASFDRYAVFADIAELYGQWEQHDFEFAVGRQVLGWGQGRVLGPVHRFDSWDQRYPIFLRSSAYPLSATSTRISRFWFGHRFDLVVRHEQRHDLKASPNGPYGHIRQWRAVADGRTVDGNAGLPAVIQNASSITPRFEGFADDAQEFLTRWFYQGASFDWSGYMAWIGHRPGVLSLADSQDQSLVLEHPQSMYLGSGGSGSLGPFLLLAEVIYQPRRPVLGADLTEDDWLLSRQEQSTLHVMGGVTYIYGLGLEVSASMPVGERTAEMLLDPEFVTRIALYATQRVLRERLQIEWVGQGYVSEGVVSAGSMHAELLYRPSDTLKVGGGLRVFAANQRRLTPIAGWRNRDELYFRLQWDLQI